VGTAQNDADRQIAVSDNLPEGSDGISTPDPCGETLPGAGGLLLSNFSFLWVSSTPGAAAAPAVNHNVSDTTRIAHMIIAVPTLTSPWWQHQ
jgi:hypothetical protein